MDEIKEPALALNPESAVVSEPSPAVVAHHPVAAPRHVFLIDGSGFIFRAYFARARSSEPVFQRKSDGMVTEVVTLFSNMLDKYRRETDADHMAVIFDASGASFRNRIYDAYKANRREMPDDLRPQLEHVRQAAAAFDICQIELQDFEADDLIATYARHAVEAGAKVTILSSDKDLMQLVSDNVKMRDPMTDRPIGEVEVREKFGVGPNKVIEVQALCGDSTDNVPGVPGIGVKTAAELINTYGDLETLLAHAHEIKQPKRREALIENEAKARLSKELVKLDEDVPLPCPLSALRVQPYNSEKLYPFLDAMELRALKSRIERRLDIMAPPPTGPCEPVIPEVPPFTRPAHLRVGRHARRSRPLDRGGIRGRVGRDLADRERGRRRQAGAGRYCAGPLARAGRLCSARPSPGGGARSRRAVRAFARSGNGPLAAATGRSGRPENQPRREGRCAPAVALERHAGALRLHDADVLRARRRAVRSRHRESGAALFRARADPAQATDRHRQEPDRLCRGAFRSSA